MALRPKPSSNVAPDVLSPIAWPEGTVWHYTNKSGLTGMISSDVLWASAAESMNDLEELHTGRALFRTLIGNGIDDVDAHIREDFTELANRVLQIDRQTTFIACASKSPDNLTMWRNYTASEDGLGFAVALDGTVPLRMRRQRPWDESMLDVLGDADEDHKQLVRDLAANGAGEFIWRAAVYDRAEQSDVAWTTLLGIEAALLARTKDRKDWSPEYAALAEAARALGTFKHWAFKDEEEMRIVCDASIQAVLMYLKHRRGRYGMTPYVELGVPKDRFRKLDDRPEPMARLPIHGVVIGPARDHAAAQADVLELLRSNGHKDACIMFSHIPFRS